MRDLCFTDCVELVGTSCPPFDGQRQYVSTGAVDVDHISEGDVEVVEYSTKPSRANLVAECGDILFAKMQGTKKTLQINSTLANNVYSTGFCAVRAKTSVLTSRCLYHLLTSETFLDQKDKNCSGATQKAITNAALSKIIINLPDIHLQDGIADQLDRIASVISVRQQELQKLDDLIKARFVEMFGDPIVNSKHLPTIRGDLFFKLSNGKFVPEEKRFEIGVPVYGGNGISWYTDEILVDTDTLVVGRVGFQSGNVHYAKGPLWVSDNAMYISNYNEKDYDLLFLCHLMEHIDFTRHQDAGDLKKITQKPFMAMEYIHPSLQQQQEYTTFVQQVDKSKVIENNAFGCLKYSLMPGLMAA